MRNYEHLYGVDGEIVIADKKSAKSKYGHYFPEYLDESSPDFLREGSTLDGHRVFQLTEPSPPLTVFQGHPIADNLVGVEEEQFSGGYSETSIHQSRIRWNDTTTLPKKGGTS